MVAIKVRCDSNSRLTIFSPFAINLYGVGGVKVSIVAFQAIDPGSIPG